VNVHRERNDNLDEVLKQAVAKLHLREIHSGFIPLSHFADSIVSLESVEQR
jgi:hypothetical protein